MKNKVNKKSIIAFIMGGIVFGSIGVYAATIAGSNISYSSTQSGLSSTNVQDAIDEIYEKVDFTINTRQCRDCSVCIRALKLHTDTCKASGCVSAGYSLNQEFAYGNLGSSKVLSAGDAFDCDVNGDGIYNSITERFYYLKDVDNDVSAFIYSNNYTTNSVKYSENGSSLGGPVTLIASLPTDNEWKNVKLQQKNRQIVDHSGSSSISGQPLPLSSVYGNAVARLLTVQEIAQICTNDGNLEYQVSLNSQCAFLFENTKYSEDISSKSYSYWLENPYGSSGAWYLKPTCNSIDATSVTGKDNIRPVIEVLKTDISY